MYTQVQITAAVRAAEAVILREAGKTFREIGEYLGVSGGRARQIFQRGERLIHRDGRPFPYPAMYRIAYRERKDALKFFRACA